jgi:hypothetical protein
MTKEEKEMRCDRRGVQAGEVRYAMTFQGDFGYKGWAESIILSACANS